ncbi:MAG TPA: ATP-binding protein, partial [Fibrobacteraceae bacterium]|nr:ATP-binding protein [Fibrobacteraceae bacterium]
RVVDIVRSLRSFSHPDMATLQNLDLREVLEDALRVTWNQVKRFEIIREYEEIPLIPGFRVLLSQVFMNLLLNAAQAMKTSGTITLRVLKKEAYVLVAVADSGPGIPKEHVSRLFDPFFTTKPVGEGTGLGLYISYGIVQKHHGDLLFSSEPGKGACFQVLLPMKQI